MTEPAGSASGDVLLYMILVELAHSAFTAPGSWAAVPNCDALDVAADFTCYCRYIVRGGSAPALGASWSGGSKYFEWSVHAFHSCDTTNPINISAATASSSGTQVNPPSVTTTADSIVCALAWHWAGWSGTATPPSGYTLRFGDSGYDHGLATKSVPTPGVEDPGTWGAAGGTDDMRGMTIAIASAGGGGGGGAFGPRRPLLGVGRNRLGRDEWQRDGESRIYTRR